MICVPISAESNAAMLSLVMRAEGQPADIHEFRLDALREPPHVERLIAAAGRPVMATCRSVGEGGAFGGTGEERRAVLRRAVDAGAAYVDLEPGDLAGLGDCGKTIRIASLHDFDRVPEDLEDRIAALCDTDAEWVKFAVAAHSHADNLKVLEALAKATKPAIAIAMGPLGVVTRILGRRFGSMVVFGSIDRGLESAPGQVTAAELARLYRVESITPDSMLIGFLGHPDHPTQGHVVHNRAFANAGMDAVCIPFFARDARDFLDSIPDRAGLTNLVVDEAHGAAALEWAGGATESAERAGHADVLVRMDGYWLADHGGEPAESDAAVIRSAQRRVQ